MRFSSFFFTATATTEIYTLSLHDALPIFRILAEGRGVGRRGPLHDPAGRGCQPSAVAHLERELDRKSTRLNSSHVEISYAVFCLKKKKNTANVQTGAAQADGCPTGRDRQA